MNSHLLPYHCWLNSYALAQSDMQIKSLSLKDAAGRVANVVLMLADDIVSSAKEKWK